MYQFLTKSHSVWVAHGRWGKDGERVENRIPHPGKSKDACKRVERRRIPERKSKLIHARLKRRGKKSKGKLNGQRGYRSIGLGKL